MSSFKKTIFFGIMYAFLSVNAKDEEPNALPQVGNFALPASQQPVPLFSFGQYILNKGILQAYLYFDVIRAHGEKYDALFPSVLYGITDSTSILVTVPFALQNKTVEGNSKGIQDMYVQLEHAYYSKYLEAAVNQATFVINMSFPTGTPRNVPPLGVGAPVLFFGGTYSHLAVDWYYYLADAVVFSMPFKGINYGTQLLYQAGFGRNLHHFEHYILTAITEFNGYFATPDKSNGTKIANTGGNTLYLGQSIWFSGEKFVFQIGVSFMPYQKLNGVQPEEKYYLAGGFAWTF